MPGQAVGPVAAAVRCAGAAVHCRALAGERPERGSADRPDEDHARSVQVALSYEDGERAS